MPSVVRSSGEAIETVVNPRTNTRISSDEMLRTRDREFYIHLLQGWTQGTVAAKYKVTQQLVSFRVRKCLPESEKLRIRRMSNVA